MAEPDIKKRKVTYPTPTMMILDPSIIRRWLGEEEVRLYNEADINIETAIQGIQN